MKTKAYKAREHIARYIYEYLGSDDISIYFDKSQSPTNSFTFTASWVVCNKDKILDGELSEKLFELSDLLGIKFGFGLPNEYTTLLWNKEKEEKYIGKKREQALALNEFKDELAFMEFYGALFHKAVEEVFVKKKEK